MFIYDIPLLPSIFVVLSLQGSERKSQMAKEYREKVEKELRDICNDVLVSAAAAGFILRLKLIYR